METIPSIEDLLTFCRVVDLGSMTTAANALGQSKGTVSRRIARLEEAVGTSLLHRRGRNVEPTEEGRAYRERVGVAVEVLEDAGAMLRAAHDEPAGLLRVTAPPDLTSSLLSRVLPGFLAAYPSISVELVLTEATLSFREHRVDIALRAVTRLSDSSLIARRLMAISALLVASPDYLARRGAPSKPSDLVDHDYLTAPVGGVQRLTLLPVDDGPEEVVHLERRVATTDLTLIRNLAIAGSGIALLPPHDVRADLDAGRLVQLLPQWRLKSSLNLYLLYAGGVMAPKVRAFRDYLQTALSAEDCP